MTYHEPYDGSETEDEYHRELQKRLEEELERELRIEEEKRIEE